jgi:phage terminase large subunit
MNFRRTKAVNRILAMKARKRVIQGGTSAGKTIAILAILIDHAAKTPKAEISVVSESIPHLRRGAIKDFAKVMQNTGRWVDERWNRTLLTYTFANGSTIEFFSADQEARLRGARRQVLYVNEANNIPFESYYQLAIRTSETIYIDFNPTATFWAHTEVLAEADSELIVLNYLDNEALPATIRTDIEAARDKAATSNYWANWWKVYGLGEVGSLQGVVFSNWQQVDTVPEGHRWKCIGLDWGFTNDVTAVVECTLVNDTDIYLRQIMYRNGLINSDIARELAAYKSHEIIADSAEPKSIEELRRHGFRIRATVKGPDSVRAGIAKMQGLRMFVTSDSIDLIRELRTYCWQTDKAGASTNEPEDANNHAIDAARYAIMDKLKARSGNYTIA